MILKKIVFCTDFSESSNNAFEIALEMAKTNQGSLDIIHIREPIVNPFITAGGGLSDEAINATLKTIEEKLEQEYGSKIDSTVNYKIIVREGHPSSEIISYLKKVTPDLVVTGSSGYSGMGLVLFGSISRRISQKAPCSVLITRRKKK
jgi:nucleotide-binding universal stress UspA family protein